MEERLPPGPLPMGPPPPMRRPAPRVDRTRPLTFDPDVEGEVIDDKARALLNCLASDVERIIYIIKAVVWAIGLVLAAALIVFILVSLSPPA